MTTHFTTEHPATKRFFKDLLRHGWRVSDMNMHELAAALNMETAVEAWRLMDELYYWTCSGEADIAEFRRLYNDAKSSEWQIELLKIRIAKNVENGEWDEAMENFELLKETL